MWGLDLARSRDEQPCGSSGPPRRPWSSRSWAGVGISEATRNGGQWNPGAPSVAEGPVLPAGEPCPPCPFCVLSGFPPVLAQQSGCGAPRRPDCSALCARGFHALGQELACWQELRASAGAGGPGALHFGSSAPPAGAKRRSPADLWSACGPTASLEVQAISGVWSPPPGACMGCTLREEAVTCLVLTPVMSGVKSLGAEVALGVSLGRLWCAPALRHLNAYLPSWEHCPLRCGAGITRGALACLGLAPSGGQLRGATSRGSLSRAAQCSASCRGPVPRSPLSKARS